MCEWYSTNEIEVKKKHDICRCTCNLLVYNKFQFIYYEYCMDVDNEWVRTRVIEYFRSKKIIDCQPFQQLYFKFQHSGEYITHLRIIPI